jgi:putative transposase
MVEQMRTIIETASATTRRARRDRERRSDPLGEKTPRPHPVSGTAPPADPGVAVSGTPFEVIELW